MANSKSPHLLYMPKQIHIYIIKKPRAKPEAWPSHSAVPHSLSESVEAVTSQHYVCQNLIVLNSHQHKYKGSRITWLPMTKDVAK